MDTRPGRTATILIMTAFTGVFAPADAESVLTLPVPGAGDHTKKAINLEIRIPQRLVPAPEPPLKEPLAPRAVKGFSEKRLKPIPQEKFVFDTLRTLEKKGLVMRELDRALILRKVAIYTVVAESIARIYDKLRDVYRNKALRKFGITISDLERFQRVLDLFRPPLRSMNFPTAVASKSIDDMIAVLEKSSGRGAIRVTGVREQEDGSTLLELEVQRFDPHLEEF